MSKTEPRKKKVRINKFLFIFVTIFSLSIVIYGILSHKVSIHNPSSALELLSYIIEFGWKSLVIIIVPILIYYVAISGKLKELTVLGSKIQFEVDDANLLKAEENAKKLVEFEIAYETIPLLVSRISDNFNFYLDYLEMKQEVDEPISFNIKPFINFIVNDYLIETRETFKDYLISCNESENFTDIKSVMVHIEYFGFNYTVALLNDQFSTIDKKIIEIIFYRLIHQFCDILN